MVDKSNPGVRFVSSMVALASGFALLLRQELFQKYSTYKPLIGIPEWTLGLASLFIGVGLAILPRNHWRRKLLLLASFWWLFWALIVVLSTGYAMFSGILFGLWMSCLIEFLNASIAAPKRAVREENSSEGPS